MKNLLLLVVILLCVRCGYSSVEQHEDESTMAEIEQYDFMQYLHDYYEMKPAGAIVHGIEVPTAIGKINPARKTINEIFAFKEIIVKQEYRSLLYSIALTDGTYATQRFEKGYFIFELGRILI